MTRLSSAFLAAILLSACGPVEEPGVARETETPGEVAEDGSEPGLGDIELCDAADFRPLIGSGIAEAVIPEDRVHRVFGEDDIVTQEYIPQRTNVVYDTKGRIVRVWCG